MGSDKVNELKERIDKLEDTTIKELEEKIHKLELELGSQLTSISNSIKSLKEDIGKIVKLSETQIRIEETIKSLENTIRDLKDIPVKVTKLEMRVERLEEKERSNARKAWEIIKVILAAIIGGLVSYVIKKFS
ncbi:MAG: hypothetical protein DSY42_00290 [Aquifex sp.]|nr:MAG: hypothetical protein DSY42_00290 [Aquifex sp.]